MWNLIKKCVVAYIDAQAEMNKMGIVIIPNWYGMTYYIDPEYYNQNKSDNNEPL